MKLVAWGKTDTGRQRDHNEDSYVVDEALGLFGVADGMGGHQGGEIASRLAVDILHRQISGARGDMTGAAVRIQDARRRRRSRLTAPIDAAEQEADEAATDPLIEAFVPPATTVMCDAARQAGTAIFEQSLAETHLRGMGTTLTAMLHFSGRMHLIHAGDSRAYLLRGGKLKQLTEDHTWIAEQVKSGAMTEQEAHESKFRHIITRSVGFERDVQVDVLGVSVQPGDCFLLCSDGMSNYIANQELESIMTSSWFSHLPDILIAIANERGGDDNITTVAVYCANEG